MASEIPMAKTVLGTDVKSHSKVSSSNHDGLEVGVKDTAQEGKTDGDDDTLKPGRSYVGSLWSMMTRPAGYIPRAVKSTWGWLTTPSHPAVPSTDVGVKQEREQLKEQSDSMVLSEISSIDLRTMQIIRAYNDVINAQEESEAVSQSSGVFSLRGMCETAAMVLLASVMEGAKSAVTGPVMETAKSTASRVLKSTFDAGKSAVASKLQGRSLASVFLTTVG